MLAAKTETNDLISPSLLCARGFKCSKQPVNSVYRESIETMEASA